MQIPLIYDNLFNLFICFLAGLLGYKKKNLNSLGQILLLVAKLIYNYYSPSVCLYVRRSGLGEIGFSQPLIKIQVYIFCADSPYQCASNL